MLVGDRSKIYTAASRSAKSVPTGRAVRLRGLVFSFFQQTVGLGHKFMTGRRWVVGDFDTRRGNIVGGILECCHIRSLRTGITTGVCRHGQRLALVLLFHQFHLGFALEFCFESGLSVGIDGLLREVVGSATGLRALLA